jgi:hypothetical protein
MRIPKLILFAPLILFLLIACEKFFNIPSPTLHRSYFPLKTGRFVEYEVMEITHDELASIKSDTLRYFLRCEIRDSFIDNAGRIAWEYVRYKRNNANQAWQESDLWTMNLSDNKAQVVEENQRFVKLVFPIGKLTLWDANQFNTENKLTCRYEQLHESLDLNALSFDSTLRVEQENVRNLLIFRRKYEIYGNNVGLVKKYFKDLNISNFDTLNIRSGKELYLTVTAFGE